MHKTVIIILIVVEHSSPQVGSIWKLDTPSSHEKLAFTVHNRRVIPEFPPSFSHQMAGLPMLVSYPMLNHIKSWLVLLRHHRYNSHCTHCNLYKYCRQRASCKTQVARGSHRKRSSPAQAAAQNDFLASGASKRRRDSQKSDQDGRVSHEESVTPILILSDFVPPVLEILLEISRVLEVEAARTGWGPAASPVVPKIAFAQVISGKLLAAAVVRYRTFLHLHVTPLWASSLWKRNCLRRVRTDFAPGPKGCEPQTIDLRAPCEQCWCVWLLYFVVT